VAIPSKKPTKNEPSNFRKEPWSLSRIALGDPMIVPRPVGPLAADAEASH
jgi:hypothetical protein